MDMKNILKLNRHSERALATEESMDPSHPLRMTQYGECGRSNPSLSSLGSARGSMWCDLNALHYAQCAQCGRSMVEMLGVLAVIGILSVAGVKGYTNAMKKHRANEILNEASKRAAIVAMQAAAGRSNLTIAEFDNNATLGFTGVNENPNNASQFQLTLSGVDEKVCAQMKNAVGTNTPVRGITSDCGTITYNKDLSTTPYASDFATEDECQSPFKWCSEAATPHCADDCCAGFVESDCQTACDSDTGEVTNAGSETTCDYTTEGAADGLCDGNGGCEEKQAITIKDKNGNNFECPADGENIYSSAGFDQSECAKCGGFAVRQDATWGWVAGAHDACHSLSASPLNTYCIKGLKTVWFDMTCPLYEEGGGDYETYAKIRAVGYDICSTPTEIKCEAENYPGLTVEQVGQHVHCNLAIGLACRNEEQRGLYKLCINYLIQITCP